CVHCHVNAGPTRTELMSRDTIDVLIDVMKQRQLTTLDLTGGAPEMNPEFRYLVTQARALGVEVIDRCNLSILLEPGYEDLAEFLAEQTVTVTASLPCYSQKNVDAQRGKGVFDKSVVALQRLNALGYGKGGELTLNLVYNPVGAHLPPPQPELKAEYSQRLQDDFNIQFDDLYTITNMPISRFGSILLSKGQFEPYMQLLRDSYSPTNLDSVMCRQLVSVDWQGNLYDCDFNQMLKLDLLPENTRTLSDLLVEDLVDEPIVVGEHCYGCTAGQGSSCGGALA
ncbi:MAG: arsenosugar biosynthesis radical SAM (seleno)protein ArsS, partial [Pseudomonadales bacterium]